MTSPVSRSPSATRLIRPGDLPSAASSSDSQSNSKGKSPDDAITNNTPEPETTERAPKRFKPGLDSQTRSIIEFDNQKTTTLPPIRAYYLFNGSIEALINDARSGNDLAQFELAHKLEYGLDGLNPNMEAARFWYKNSKENENARADLKIKSMHGELSGNPPQAQEIALGLLKTKADRGSVSAMLDLGMIFYHGKPGLAQNFDEAARWFTKGASTKDSNSLFWRGTMHYLGQGGSQNYNDAFACFKEGGDLGHSGCLCQIGFMQLNGLGTTTDRTLGINNLDKSARLGNPAAMRHLADEFLKLQDPTGASEKAGISLYLKAAELNYTPALNFVGYMFLYGSHGAKQDTNKASEYFSRSAVLGDAIGSMPFLAENR